jgi:hypothetical protein
MAKISCEILDHFLQKYLTKISWQRRCWHCRTFSSTGHTLDKGAFVTVHCSEISLVKQ